MKQQRLKRERMVKTPWFEKAIPFHEAAETEKRTHGKNSMV